MRYGSRATIGKFAAILVFLVFGSPVAFGFDAGLTNFAVSQGKKAIERCRQVGDAADRLDCVAKGLDKTANNVGRPDYAPAVRKIRKAAKNVRAAAKKSAIGENPKIEGKG